MKSTDDQLREIMKRADHVKERKSMKKAVTSYALSACACLVVLVVTAFHLPGLSVDGSSEISGHYGSLLLNTSYLGYVAIGVLAFLFGISLTLLCMQISRLRKKERDRK